jgi:hypothetical protein
VGDLRQGYRECREGCADVVTRARKACSEDPTSDACAAGREAVAECLTPCAERARAGLQTCREMSRECVAGCGTDEDE